MDEDKSKLAAILPLSAEGSEVFRAYLTAEMMMGHQSAKAVGLSAADFFGLNVISLYRPISAGDLSARTGLTTGATTRMIDRLESARFVRRVADPDDRRKVLVEPDNGRQAEIDAALEPSRRQLGSLLTAYGEAELGVLFDYFARATPLMLAATEELRERETGA